MEELLQIMWSFVDGIIDPKYHVIDMNPFIEGWSGHAAQLVRTTFVSSVLRVCSRRVFPNLVL